MATLTVPVPRRRAPALLAAVLTAVLAGLLAYAGTLAVAAVGSARADGARQAVAAAAQTEALDLTTIDYRTATRDVNRIIAGATGGLARQFTAERAQFPSVLAKSKAVSRGTVLSTAVTYVRGETAQALVAVDADVTTSAGGTTRPQQVVKHYRMVLTLVSRAGRWLVRDVAFAGQPQ